MLLYSSKRSPLLPISTFLLFLICWIGKFYIINELIRLSVDVISYLLLPVALLMGIAQLRSRHTQYWALLLLLFGFGVSHALVGGIALSNSLQLNNLQSLQHQWDIAPWRTMAIGCWYASLLLLAVGVLLLLLKRKQLLKPQHTNNHIVTLALVAAAALYILSYPYFEAHYGWGGMHGHPLWESGNHLH